MSPSVSVSAPHFLAAPLNSRYSGKNKIDMLEIHHDAKNGALKAGGAASAVGKSAD